MALSMKDQLMKDNVINFLADIPAYAFVAYANFVQIVPSDYPAWERFLLKHGWLILLSLRISVAVYDLVLRLKGNYWITDQEGKPRKRSVLDIIKNEIKPFASQTRLLQNQLSTWIHATRIEQTKQTERRKEEGS